MIKLFIPHYIIATIKLYNQSFWPWFLVFLEQKKQKPLRRDKARVILLNSNQSTVDKLIFLPTTGISKGKFHYSYHFIVVNKSCYAF